MTGYISSNGIYHEGDKQDGDILVPLCPSMYHSFNDQTQTWYAHPIKLMNGLRTQRVAKLDDADIRVNKAMDMGTAQQLTNAKAYRQALRDLPTNPANVSLNANNNLVVIWPALSV